MLLVDAGERLALQGTAVSTLTLTPLFDRAAIIHRIYIDKPSAGDTWILTVRGQEIARFDIQTTGNQQPLSGPNSGYPKENDIHEVYKQLSGEELTYPVPQGASAVITNVGGATANIMFYFSEQSPADVTPALLNHPDGQRVVSPVAFYVNTAVAATATAGEVAFDTEVKPTWFPLLFRDGSFPAGFAARVLCLFTEGGGVNTFSGSANHQSTTVALDASRNGQRLYTRSNPGGLTVIGQASAAGSANTVVNADTALFPAFQYADPFDYMEFPLNIRYNPGDLWQWRLLLTGDTTGTASYATIRMLALVEMRFTGAQP